jgi:hypothetical protein
VETDIRQEGRATTVAQATVRKSGRCKKPVSHASRIDSKKKISQRESSMRIVSFLFFVELLIPEFQA